MMKSNTAIKAQHELNILEKTTKDAIIIPFRKELLALVEKFGNSEQSGGSASYVAEVLSSAVKKLCLQKPICDLTGIPEEWSNVKPFFQNNRLSSVFKDALDDKAYYIDAIIFDGDIGGSFTSNGSVKLKDGSILSSKQYIKSFPFKPKTFRVDVIDHRFDQDSFTKKLTPNPDGDWWEHEIKDESQLVEIFEYYDRK